MVLYRVYSQPHLNKYYSTVCSKATLFQIVLYSLMLIPPFFIAYATNDFWQYTSSYREQPRVQFLNQILVRIGDSSSSGTRLWSSFPNLNLLLQPGEAATPVVRSREDDTNRDGRNDVLHLRVEFSDLGQDVNTVQLLLFFHMKLSLFSSVTLHSLAHFSSSWAAPASRLWVGGDLGVWQRRPLPSTGRVEQYNASLFNSSSSRAEEFDITTILSRYNERNLTTVLSNSYSVWENGATSNFTIELELRYPTQTITYYPGFWQLVKFAWVQYLAILIVFWWVLRRVQAFVFQNQIILTVCKRTDKPHKH